MDQNLQDKLSHLPDKPGSYIMKDERGEVIYVGKASSLRSRVRSYFQKGQTHTAKTLILVSKIRDVDWLVTETEVEALMLECNLIKKHRPRYNIRLRDDKHYPYLCITTSEPFPRALIVRRVKADGNRYFGPFADSSALRQTVRTIRKLFCIRNCNKSLTPGQQPSPCLNYHMRQCDAPCVEKISVEEYGRNVQDTMLFLEGRQDKLIGRMEKEMEEAAENLQFERAARLRDQIAALRVMVEKQRVISTDLTDQDVISINTDSGSACVQVLSIRSGKLIGQEHLCLDGTAEAAPEESLGEFIKQYYRDTTYVPKEVLVSHEPTESGLIQQWLTAKRGGAVKLIRPQRGEKRKLVEMATENATLAGERERSLQLANKTEGLLDLDDLRQSLEMDEIPVRIEAYDISNIQGRDAVGSMVVFVDGAAAKSEYRRFKIRAPEQPDDYGMMREVIRRRLDQAAAGDRKFSTLPDLMLIDGGKGHLNAAREAMAPTQYDIPMISIAKRLEEIHSWHPDSPLLLPREARALRLLQRIRDEAHRFAIGYHHKLREKIVKKSLLDSVPGVGDARRKALIRRFGSVTGVRQASIEELMQAPGITRPVAQAVYDALHGGE